MKTKNTINTQFSQLDFDICFDLACDRAKKLTDLNILTKEEVWKQIIRWSTIECNIIAEANVFIINKVTKDLMDKKVSVEQAMNTALKAAKIKGK